MKNETHRSVFECTSCETHTSMFPAMNLGRPLSGLAVLVFGSEQARLSVPFSMNSGEFAHIAPISHPSLHAVWDTVWTHGLGTRR